MRGGVCVYVGGVEMSPPPTRTCVCVCLCLGDVGVYVGGGACVCIYVESGRDESLPVLATDLTLQPLYEGVLAMGGASHLVGTG